MSLELWQTAQTVLEPRTEGPRTRVRSDALLSEGLLRCASCGGPLTYERTPTWIGYRCGRASSGARCEAPAAISAKTLEPYIEGMDRAPLGGGL